MSDYADKRTHAEHADGGNPMTDRITTIITIGLSLALGAGIVAHTKAGDRAELADCRADLAVDGKVADACMAVAEQCRALVEGHACSCWSPDIARTARAGE